jgi:hypothetical protein
MAMNQLNQLLTVIVYRGTERNISAPIQDRNEIRQPVMTANLSSSVIDRCAHTHAYGQTYSERLPPMTSHHCFHRSQIIEMDKIV